MLQTKCLLWVKELSKAGCLEEAGLRLKLEKPSGRNCVSLQTRGSLSLPVRHALSLTVPCVLTISLSSCTFPDRSKKTTADPMERRCQHWAVPASTAA